MREKWMSALRVVMMAGLSALICGVIVALGIAGSGSFNSWKSLAPQAVVAPLVAVVVLLGLLTLGQLYGYLFAKWGWLSLRNTIVVGVIAQGVLLYFAPGKLGAVSEGDRIPLIHSFLIDWVFGPELRTAKITSEFIARVSTVADWMDWFFGGTTELEAGERFRELFDRITTVANWIRKALITSPASIGLVLFYALHLRHKKQPLTTANA